MKTQNNGKNIKNRSTKKGFLMIPFYILKRKDLNSSQKMVLARIKSLSKQKGYCYASNKYLCENLSLSIPYIKTILNKLEKKNEIKRNVVRDKRTRRVKLRKIFPKVFSKIEGGKQKNMRGGMSEHPVSITEKRITDKKTEDTTIVVSMNKVHDVVDLDELLSNKK